MFRRRSCLDTNLGSHWTPPSHLASVFSSHSGHSACWEHGREPKCWMRLMGPSHTFGVPEVAPRVGQAGEERVRNAVWDESVWDWLTKQQPWPLPAVPALPGCQ